MSITAKELAARLHISAAAVSLALNGKPGVSEETRARVIQLAKAYGYDFNKNRNNQSSRTIRFVIYKKDGAIVTNSTFFMKVQEGIETECHKQGYHLLLSYISKTECNRQTINELTMNCDGIILLATEMSTDDYELFKVIKKPLLLLDSCFDDIQHNCVIINNTKGAFAATEYLIDTYHSPPGYISSSYSIYNFSERANGYFKAIRQHGYSFSKCQIIKVIPSVEGAEYDVTSFLENETLINNTFFADNDLIAMGAIRAFRKKGYKVPQDIAIVGFDNIAQYMMMEPPFTTVHVPKTYMGKMAARRLMEVIELEEVTNVKIEIDTTLIIEDKPKK